jgi:hypothetical protein
VKKLILLLTILLSGCSITAVPVTPKFPEAPASLQERCAALKEVTEDASLSDFTKIVVENYILYHECSRKVEGWNEWYAKQKAIFEEATK